jgi:hypothetical protein
MKGDYDLREIFIMMCLFLYIQYRAVFIDTNVNIYPFFLS